MYFPSIEWDKVSIEAYFVEDQNFSCCEDTEPCKYFQDNYFRLPDALASPLVSLVVDRLMKTYLQIPQDSIIDKNENHK